MAGKLIVCLTGMPGSGKSTIAAGLASAGYEVVTLGDEVRAEARRRNMEPSRSNLGMLMIELRKRGGPGAVAELAGGRIRSSGAGVVIVDGVRSADEVEVLKKSGDVRLLAIHASADSRFGFLRERGRSDDPKTRGHFEERDGRELDVGISRPIALSDRTISNSGITREELVESALSAVRAWESGRGQGTG